MRRFPRRIMTALGSIVCGLIEAGIAWYYRRHVVESEEPR